jgi:hypothetical protein
VVVVVVEVVVVVVLVVPGPVVVVVAGPVVVVVACPVVVVVDAAVVAVVVVVVVDAACVVVVVAAVVVVVVGGVVVVVVDATVVDVVPGRPAGHRQSAPHVASAPHAEPGGSQSSRPGVTVPSPQRAEQSVPPEVQQELQVRLKSAHAARSVRDAVFACFRHCRWSAGAPVQSASADLSLALACVRHRAFETLQLFRQNFRAEFLAAEA